VAMNADGPESGFRAQPHLISSIGGCVSCRFLPREVRNVAHSRGAVCCPAHATARCIATDRIAHPTSGTRIG
jgi:hypothetical protein